MLVELIHGIQRGLPYQPYCFSGQTGMWFPGNAYFSWRLGLSDEWKEGRFRNTFKIRYKILKMEDMWRMMRDGTSTLSTHSPTLNMKDKGT